jgi:hypothetical protein
LQSAVSLPSHLYSRWQLGMGLWRCSTDSIALYVIVVIIVIVVKMVRQSSYLSRHVWSQIDAGTRRAVLKATGLRRTEIVDNGWFVSTLISRLWELGETGLAERVLGREEEVE